MYSARNNLLTLNILSIKRLNHFFTMVIVFNKRQICLDSFVIQPSRSKSTQVFSLVQANLKKLSNHRNVQRGR